MIKPEWGKKRKCVKCNTLFYDMKKDTFSCPKCGKEYSDEQYTDATIKKILKSGSKNPLPPQDILEDDFLSMPDTLSSDEDFTDDIGLDVLEEEEDTDAGEGASKRRSIYPEDEENE